MITELIGNKEIKEKLKTIFLILRVLGAARRSVI